MSDELRQIQNQEHTWDGSYHLVRSSRKTIAIIIRRDGTVEVRAPFRTSKAAIETFLMEKIGWIQRHLTPLSGMSGSQFSGKTGNNGSENGSGMEKEHGEPLIAFTPEELMMFAQKAKKVIPERAAWYAAQMGVTYHRITIRAQKTRWGSCSTKGNLNFNCLLVLVPSRVLDYVVVHELCHLLEMNHSPQFWAAVARVMPDYREQRQWLRAHERELIGRLP